MKQMAEMRNQKESLMQNKYNMMVLNQQKREELARMKQFYERQSRSLEREDPMDYPYYSGRAHKEQLLGVTRSIPTKPQQFSTPVLPRVYNHLNVEVDPMPLKNYMKAARPAGQTYRPTHSELKRA